MLDMAHRRSQNYSKCCDLAHRRGPRAAPREQPQELFRHQGPRRVQKRQIYIFKTTFFCLREVGSQKGAFPVNRKRGDPCRAQKRQIYIFKNGVFLSSEIQLAKTMFFRHQKAGRPLRRSFWSPLKTCSLEQPRTPHSYPQMRGLVVYNTYVNIQPCILSYDNI